MAKVELKKPIVEEIKANLEGAATAVVVDYRGLTVEQDTQLRKNLREAGVVYKVYKNTMVNFAIEGTEFEGLKGCLEGPTGLAICKDDATAAARVLADFAKNAPAQRSLQETRLFPSSLEVSSHLSQTSLVLSSRSQSRRRLNIKPDRTSDVYIGTAGIICCQIFNCLYHGQMVSA